LTELEHRQIVSIIQAVADKVILVGEMTKKYTMDELQKIGYDMTMVDSYLSSDRAGEDLRALLKQSDEKYILVCKGSQNTIFIEEVIKHLLADPADVSLLPRQ
jgi:GTP cyclohydrolase FolE2